MRNSITILIITASILAGQTNNQIKQAKNYIKKTGMSETQARSLAKSKGFSEKQINAAIEKEKKQTIEKTQTENETSDKIVTQQVDKSNQIPQNQLNPKISSNLLNENPETIEVDESQLMVDDEVIRDSSLVPQFSDEMVSIYFGYDIFKRDPGLFQASSVGVVDPEYLIGPGDEIIVMLWGETQFRQVLEVDREGFIFIPEIGQVFVNGLNLSLLESKLFRVLSQAYASLNPQGGKPTTFLDVSLGELRPLRIQVLGEVSQPGAYTVSPSATLFSSLYYFNGPTTLGSLRDIRLIRGGEEIISIDFYDYLLTGKQPNDIKLQLDDVIFIPKRLKTISINGEVNRPGIYELEYGETLKDIIQISGDLKITADLDRAQIDRIVPFEKRSEMGIDRMITDINLQELMKSNIDFELQDGDQIQIFSVLDTRQNIVNLIGAVTRPGSYDIGDSLRLSDLINKADGLLGDAYLDRVDIVRTNPDLTEELIKLDYKKVIEGNTDNDILLNGLDNVRVYSISEMVKKSYVSINGHVKRPGQFILQKNMSLYDLIFKAGGFLDEEFKNDTYLERAELVRNATDQDEKEIIAFSLDEVINNKGLASEALRAKDAVRIYSIKEVKGEKKYVSIKGHVKKPGKYELYEDNMTIYDLLFKTSGFDDNEFKSATFLERADLIRISSNGVNKTIIPFNLGEVLDHRNDKSNFKLFSGDEIRIYSKEVFNPVHQITIDGVINSPGNYELKNRMTIKDLIFEAGGLSKDIYKYNIIIARIDPEKVSDESYSETIELNMFSDYSISATKGDFFDNNLKRDGFMLKPYDYITIRPDPHFRMQRLVSIEGAVYYPGKYALKGPNETLSDIIERSGGLRRNAYPFASTFTRFEKMIQLDISKILNKKHSKADITLQDGDQIFVATRPTITQVMGEVNSPGFYKYIENRRINDFINYAGGYSQDANKDDIWIKYPNGKSKKYHRIFSNPKVLDGSIITVGKMPEEEPFDKTEYAKELTAIIANLAQAMSIAILATRN